MKKQIIAFGLIASTIGIQSAPIFAMSEPIQSKKLLSPEVIEESFGEHFDKDYMFIEPDFDFDIADHMDFNPKEDKEFILEDLAYLMEEIEDKTKKEALTKQVTVAKKIENFDKFIEATDAIYDEIYSLIGDEDFDIEEYEYNFKEEKKFIIEDLQKEVNEIKNEAQKKTLSKEVSALKNLNDEEKFFDALDNVYEKMDPILRDQNFPEEKKLIIKDLQEMMNEIEDKAQKEELTKQINTLKNITKAEEFHNKVDEVYEKFGGIGIIECLGDHDDADFHFEPEHIDHIHEEEEDHFGDIDDEDENHEEELQELEELEKEIDENIKDKDLAEKIKGFLYSLFY